MSGRENASFFTQSDGQSRWQNVRFIGGQSRHHMQYMCNGLYNKSTTLMQSRRATSVHKSMTSEEIKPSCDMCIYLKTDGISAMDFTTCMLVFDPNRRPPCRATTGHPYIKSVTSEAKLFAASVPHFDFWFEKDQDLLKGLAEEVRNFNVELFKLRPSR